MGQRSEGPGNWVPHVKQIGFLEPAIILISTVPTSAPVNCPKLSTSPDANSSTCSVVSLIRSGDAPTSLGRNQDDSATPDELPVPKPYRENESFFRTHLRVQGK